MYSEERDMTDEAIVVERAEPRLGLVQFFKQFFGNYKGFLETHLKTERPPFLLLMIWFLGMASLIDRMELRYLLSSKYQLDDWVSTWLLILLAGIISGCMGYWLVGAWYHLRVLVCGGLRKFKTSRHLSLYTKIPTYGLTLAFAVFNTVVYGDKYFTEPTSWDLDLMWAGLTFVAVIYSISLSYRGARLLQEAKRARAIIFFIILPGLFFVLLQGGIFVKTYSEHSKGINYNQEAIEAMARGDYDRAEEMLKQALKYMTKDEQEDLINIYDNLGLAHEYQEETEEAIDCYEEILEFCDSNSTMYHSTMGKIKILQEELQVAIAHFERALQLDPDNSDAHNQLGVIYLGWVDEEIENLERALIHNERAQLLLQSFATTENLAINYFLLERYADALPLFESLDEALPDYALAKYFLGLIYYANGDLTKAVDLLEKAVYLEPAFFNEEVERIIKEATDQGGTT